MGTENTASPAAAPAAASTGSPASGATSPAGATAAPAAAAAGVAATTPEATSTEPSSDKSLMNTEDSPESGEQPAEGEAKTEGDAKEAPEYTDFTTPEGITVDETRMTEFKALAAESGLSQEHAQKLLDKHHEIVKETADQGHKLWNDLKTKWHQEINSDPDIGGQNLSESKRLIAQFIDSVAGKTAKETRAAFDLTGAGDNPHVVRLLVKAARVLGTSEGKPLMGGNPPAGKGDRRTAGQIVYPAQQGLGNSHLT